MISKEAQGGAMRTRRLTRSLFWLATAAVTAGLLVQGWFALQVWQYRDSNPEMTAFMVDGLKRLRENDPQASLTYRFVGYERISPYMKRAAVAAEDAKFVSHYGFDLEGIQHALEKNLRQGEPVAGGSSISQQLAKNLFLSGSRSYLRKGQEALITLMIEAMLSKERILELYLNVAEWGNGLYGVEAAARYYYGIPASQLGPWQAARLAAMLPKPRFYQRVGSTDWLAQKTGIIQRRMPKVTVP
jgi:monofunctional biosynthetic peptidoglycan transglycosylase